MLNECINAVREAGRRIVNAHSISVEEKTDFRNLVTQYDKMTQEFLVERLKHIAPEASFLCEESEDHTMKDGQVFIIDPIDGTANFTKRYNLSAISVGYAKDGRMEWGIIYNPFTDELWQAQRGKGAFLNGKQIHISEGGLTENLVAFGTSPYNRDMKNRTMDLVSDILDISMDVRRCGSAALDMSSVSCGRCGLFFELQLSVWDYAAGLVIVEEAGGTVTDIYGKPIDLSKEKSSMLAGNPQCHSEFLNRYRF